MKIQRRAAALFLGWCACSGGDDVQDKGPTDDTDGQHTGTTLETTGTPGTKVPKVWVNEVMAQNATGLQDESGAFPDWIELYNPNDAVVDIEGWWLTDDVANKFKWQVPAGVTIDPKGYLVVFADGDTAEGPLHASFQLGGLKNEDVALYGPNVEDNPLVDSVEDMGIQVPDVSLARMPDAGPTWEQDASATPGESNQ